MQQILRVSFPVLLSVLAFGASAPLAFAADLYVNAAAELDGDGTSPSTATTTIQAAVAAANLSDTIHVAAGIYALDSQIRITKGLTIVGAGESTVITTTGSWTNSTGSKGYAPLITISGVSAPVVLQDLKVMGAKNIAMTPSGTDYGHGINVVSSSDVTLTNVTSIGNQAAGLIVNSSHVVANNLNASGNGWYSVNVDQQDSGPASFTLTGSGVLGDNFQIDSDKTTGATVAAHGYTPYRQADGNVTLWTTRALSALSNVVYLTHAGTPTLYATIPHAVAAAADGDTVNVGAGTYRLTSQIRVTAGITLAGAGDSTVVTKATAAWTNTSGSKGYAPLITVNAGDKAVVLQNFKVTGAKNIAMAPSGTDYGHGINVVSSSNVVLNNITSASNDAAGLVVNGSTVSATNLTTSGNGWNKAVNVDPGSGITTPSVFTLTSGSLSEATQIWSDGSRVSSTATVAVTAVGYTRYDVNGYPTYFTWANKLPPNAVAKGTTLYSTIGAAVSAASDSDIIYVSAGSYPETGQVVIDKNLSIIGVGTTKDDVVLTAPFDAHSWIKVNPGKSLTLRNLTMNGTGFTSSTGGNHSAALEVHGSITVDNVAFKNIKSVASGWGVQSDAIVFYGEGVGDKLTVENSSFENIERDGIYLGMSPSVATPAETNVIRANIYKGKGAGNWLDYFVTVNYGVNANITNNTVSDSLGVYSDGSDSSGIAVWDDAGTQAVFAGNTFTNNTSGIAIATINDSLTDPVVTIESNNVFSGNGTGVAVQSISGSVGSPTVAITNATFTGNTKDITVDAGMTADKMSVQESKFSGRTATITNAGIGSINATKNWWGTGVETGIDAKIVGGVTHAEWYLDSGLSALNTSIKGTEVTVAGNFVPETTSVGQVTLPTDTSTLTMSNTSTLDLSSGTSTVSAGSVTLGGVSVGLNGGLVAGVDLNTAPVVGSTTVTISQAVTLSSGTSTPIVITNSALANVSASIPDDTTVMAPSGWDGTIAPPKAGTSTGDTAPTGFSVGSTVIDVGSSNAVLLFTKPVTLTLAGVTGTVGYKPAGSTSWTKITTVCGGTYASPDSPVFPGECAVTNGTDTKILTYHFTTFGGLSVNQPTISPSGAVFHGTQNVSMSADTGLTIHYTTDGSKPTCSSTSYSTSFTIAGDATVKAVSCDGTTASAVTTATFSQYTGGGSSSGGSGGGGSIAATPAVPAIPTVSPAIPAVPATPAVKGKVLGAEAYNFTKDLRLGSKGTDVTELQKFLMAAGLSLPDGATGYFGKQTRAAVLAFQKARGIAQVGNVGPMTRAALNKGSTGTTAAETTTSSNSSATTAAAAPVAGKTNLTASQANAIITMVQAFGADAAVVAQVKAALGQ